MALDRQSVYLSFTCAIDNTDEVAVTGLHLSGTSGFTGAVAAKNALAAGSNLSDIYDLFVTMMTSPYIRWADYSNLMFVKAAALDTAGHYIDDPAIFESVSPDGGSTGQVVPQASVVLSLRSPNAIGEANYGRMYLPHCALPLITGAPFGTVAAVEGFSAAAGAFITSIADITNGLSTPTLPVIMSAKGSGTTKGITRIAIGDVVDTQRRRRNRLTETYEFTTV